MHITIRHGVLTDAPALAEFAAQTFRDAFGADNRPEDMAFHMAHAYGTPQQQAELADPRLVTLLVDVDGRLAGYAQLRSGLAPAYVTGASPIELWRFYVDRVWHGQGIAQALMKRVDAEAVQRGARTLWLGVWERNPRARAYYHKTGFVDVGSHVFMVGMDAQTDRILTRALLTD
jgi:GNAT superfamily N-acetyltransferase